MAVVLALPKLYDDVVASFAADSITCASAFGRKAENEHMVDDRRIVWIPGDPVGSVGTIGPARQPGRDPRPLGTLYETFHVVISARDLVDRTDRAQYVACRLLFDDWFRAAKKAAGSRLRIENTAWDTTKLVRELGACIRVTCTIEAALVDAPETTTATAGATAGPNASLDVTLLDVTQRITTAFLARAASQSGDAISSYSAFSGATVIDGVTVVPGDVVLLASQMNPALNGLWEVSAETWARTTDPLLSGMCVLTAEGDSGAAYYRLTTPDPITPNVTSLTWERF